MDFTNNEMIFEYIFNTYSVDKLKKYVKQWLLLASTSLGQFPNVNLTKMWNVFRDNLLNDDDIDEYEYLKERMMNIQNFAITEYNFILDDVYSSSNLQEGKVLDINSLRYLMTKPFVINKEKVLQHVNKYIDEMPNLPYFNDIRQLLIKLKQKLVDDEIKEFPFDRLSIKLYRDKIHNINDFENIFDTDDTKRMSDYVIIAADK